jgi:hypothetical protein
MPLRLFILLATAVLPLAAVEYDLEPILYSSSASSDRISRLAGDLERGKLTLAYDQRFGYLPALLAAAGVPRASQVLVFSKTSLQKDRISPQAPRALYFNDEVYIGAVQDGAVLEIAATDAHLGQVFYTLAQERQERPRLVRQTHECLQCHDSQGFTGGVPGLIMRSVFPDANGQPILTAGTFVTDHTSPWEQRWGGWYVTGSHGAMRHLGNLLTDERTAPDGVDRGPGANRRDLAAFIDARNYLEPGSDVVALMVLGHQTRMHNLLTQAGYETRLALQSDDEINRALGRPATYRSESTVRRIASAGDKVVAGLLFSGEPALTSPVVGDAEFAKGFAAAGPRDPQGRSLRDLDLQRRLLRHPCSHLIYSPAFDALPGEMAAYIYERLWDVLSGADQRPAFAHLSAGDRRAIREILLATKPELPAWWREKAATLQ